MTLANDLTIASQGAAQIQEALVDIEANGASYGLTDEQIAEVKAIHGELYRLAKRAEGALGATEDSLANPQPLDGTPKPNP
jgi:hypothetical protein